MLRRVAFKKAVLAGILGAVGWEIAARSLIGAGVPLFDIVFFLGTMAFGRPASAWEWWPVGLLMHSMVGAIWAIFYAYFFWSAFDQRPPLQGMLFSVFPAILAGLIMIPQMDFMHGLVLDRRLSPLGIFAAGIGWGGPTAVLLGHFVYGAILGGIYTRPVGYPVGRRVTIDV